MKFFIPFCCLCLFAFNRPAEKKMPPVPVSDLGHIDIILDTATWAAVKNNAFMQQEFGVMNNDTAYYGGKPSYDIYLLGQLNFLHISQANGFWAGKRGSGVLVFQTQKPGMKDDLLRSWKQYYHDSLFVHSFKGSDYILDEIMAWYKTDSTQPKVSALFANLTTYSPEAYKNWGISDSMVTAGQAMKQFMADWGGKELHSRLFHSITALYMTLNKKEFIEIRSSLLATGYRQNGNTFTHAKNPPVFITVSEATGQSKYSKVKFRLTRATATKEIIFSPMLGLKLHGIEGELLIN